MVIVQPRLLDSRPHYLVIVAVAGVTRAVKKAFRRVYGRGMEGGNGLVLQPHAVT